MESLAAHVTGLQGTVAGRIW